MSPKHTPGPLVQLGVTGNGIDRAGCEVCNFIAIGTPNGGATAYVAYKPDADLYMAAPELLEAARRSQGKLYAYMGVCKDDNELPKIISLLGAAIAKAEGVDPANGAASSSASSAEANEKGPQGGTR